MSINSQAGFYASIDDEQIIAQEVFCLPLFLSPWDILSELEIEGLLLTPTLPGVYKRVGIFSSSPTPCETLFEKIRHSQKGEHVKQRAGRNVVLDELWQDIGLFLGRDKYEKLEVAVFELEIV